MANKTIFMLQVRRIIQLKQQGKSNRQIAREIGLSCDTVNDYIRSIEKAGIALSDLSALSEELLSLHIYAERSALHRDWRYHDFQQRIQGLCQELTQLESL